MEDPPKSTGARLLAVAALAVGLVALVVVLASSGVLGGGGDQAEAPKQAAQGETQETQAETRARTSKSREERLPKDTYTVKTNDTLGGISEKTGISVERLQELNPEVDAQQLVSGQKLKLRE